MRNGLVRGHAADQQDAPATARDHLATEHLAQLDEADDIELQHCAKPRRVVVEERLI